MLAAWNLRLRTFQMATRPEIDEPQWAAPHPGSARRPSRSQSHPFFRSKSAQPQSSCIHSYRIVGPEHLYTQGNDMIYWSTRFSHNKVPGGRTIPTTHLR